MLVCVLEWERLPNKSDCLRIRRKRVVVIVHWPSNECQTEIIIRHGISTHVLHVPDRLTPRKLHTRPLPSTKWRP